MSNAGFDLPPPVTPEAPPPLAPGPAERHPRRGSFLHHPLLYAVLALGWVSTQVWDWLPAPELPDAQSRAWKAHPQSRWRDVLGADEELDLRAALVVLPPLIFGCGLLVGYIVLRSYDIRVFPRCEFPTVPWSAWHLLRCAILFLVVQRLALAGMGGLEHVGPAHRLLARLPPMIVQVVAMNLIMLTICAFVVVLVTTRRTNAAEPTRVHDESGYPLALVPAGRQDALRALGLRETRVPSRVAIGLMGYVMIFPLFILAALIMALFGGAFGVRPEQQPVMAAARTLSSSAFLVLAFSAVILAPLTEELLFRGFLYGTLRRYMGPLGAICVSAATFAVAHGFAFGFLPLFVIGFLLCYLYERTGSLVASMAAHAAHNLYMLAALRILQSHGGL